MPGKYRSLLRLIRFPIRCCRRSPHSRLDCSITLASHPLHDKSPTSLRGVDNKTISGNESSKNGLGEPGEGAGVGLFISGPGLETSGNVVTGNELTGNGLPGVALHQHVSNNSIQNLSDNLIIGNYIAGNAEDNDLPTTPPTGISLLGVSAMNGTVITLNEFSGEQIDIAINNAGGNVDVHYNSLKGNGTGITNVNSSGAVNGTENWWGCAKGPGAPSCTSVSGSNVVDSISPELAYGETGGLSGSVKGRPVSKDLRVEGGFLSRWLADAIYTAIGTAFIHLSAGA